MRGKLAAFEEQDALDPFDVVFLGSSRIYHGVRPAIFDARMAERGYSVHSFNLGVTGQKIDGAFGTLSSLKASKPRGLRYVFIDPERISLMLAPASRAMRGLVYAHDVGSSKLLLDYIWNSELETEEKLERTNEILKACAYDTANVGRGLLWLDKLLGRAPAEDRIAFRVGPSADGWRSKDHQPKPGSARAHRQFLAELGPWHAVVNSLARTEPGTQPLDPNALPLITRLADFTRELGAEPIFFISPTTYYQGQLIGAHEAGHIDTLFRFNDPEAYPELYEPAARWEAAHLAAEGAERFSLRLADRFADWLDERKENEQ